MKNSNKSQNTSKADLQKRAASSPEADPAERGRPDMVREPSPAETLIPKAQQRSVELI